MMSAIEKFLFVTIYSLSSVKLDNLCQVKKVFQVVWVVKLLYIVILTRRYGPLRGPISAEGFFALREKKQIIMIFFVVANFRQF